MTDTGAGNQARKGSLFVIGSGIRLGQLTLEAHQAVVSADIVFALVANQLAFDELKSFNPNIVNLNACYARGRERRETYHEMVDLVLAAVRQNQSVCFAIYGHPAVFAYPSRIAMETARAEGYKVKMLPGISAEDNLFCDLEIDPSVHGCQVYSATAFLVEGRVFDPRSVLTLWQASIIGESRLMNEGKADFHSRLCDRLEAVYGPNHPVILYEAATNCLFGPDIRSIPLSRLRNTKIQPCCTLVVPPIDCPNLVRNPISAR